MKVLILEDSIFIARGISRYLKELYDNVDINIINESKDIENAIIDNYDLVILDYNFAFKYFSKLDCPNIVTISGDYLGLNKKFLLKPFDKIDLHNAIEDLSNLFLK